MLQEMKGLLTAGLVAAMIVPTAAMGIERFEPGDDAYAACKIVVLYEGATTFSKPIKPIKFGKILKVRAVEAIFELPSTDFFSKKVLEQEEEELAMEQDREPEQISPELYTRAAWLKFDGGYGPASCFVSEDLFKSQNPKEAQKRVEALAASKAKRNFSEGESGDMTAMRGAAGKAKGGKANYAAIDEIISAVATASDLNGDKTFRRTGKLGEFK